MSPSPVNEVSCVSHPISSTSSFDATVVPVPPPPRPPRPVKVPGYLLTAPTQADAQQWLEQRVFYIQDRTILQSIRQKQPIFLLDAQAQRLHGVFQRVQDMLQQDLTSPPGQHGYQVRCLGWVLKFCAIAGSSWQQCQPGFMCTPFSVTHCACFAAGACCPPV